MVLFRSERLPGDGADGDGRYDDDEDDGMDGIEDDYTGDSGK